MSGRGSDSQGLTSGNARGPCLQIANSAPRIRSCRTEMVPLVHLERADNAERNIGHFSCCRQQCLRIHSNSVIHIIFFNIVFIFVRIKYYFPKILSEFDPIIVSFERCDSFPPVLCQSSSGQTTFLKPQDCGPRFPHSRCVIPGIANERLGELASRPLRLKRANKTIRVVEFGRHKLDQPSDYRRFLVQFSGGCPDDGKRRDDQCMLRLIDLLSGLRVGEYCGGDRKSAGDQRLPVVQKSDEIVDPRIEVAGRGVDTTDQEPAPGKSHRGHRFRRPQCVPCPPPPRFSHRRHPCPQPTRQNSAAGSRVPSGGAAA